MEDNKKKTSCLGIIQIYFGACFLLFGIIVFVIGLPLKFYAPFILIGLALTFTSTSMFRRFMSTLLVSDKRKTGKEGTN